MPKIVVKTGTTQDGEFDLDLSNFTGDEYIYIKAVAGVRAPEVAREWFAGDAGTFFAVLGVMMQRAGRDPDLAALQEKPFSCFTIDYSDVEAQLAEEAKVGPPDQPPSGDGSLGEKTAEPAVSG